MEFKPLADWDGWEALQKDGQGPFLLAKLSPVCGVSCFAEKNLRQFLAGPEAQGLEAYSLDVIAQRSLSRRIAEAIDIPHASPQALVIAQGRCLWHASHGELTVPVLREAITKLLKNA